MARIIALDTGYVGLACDKPKPSSEGDNFRVWMSHEFSSGTIIIIPVIADYETRRSLILDESWDSIARLETLYEVPTSRNKLNMSRLPKPRCKGPRVFGPRLGKQDSKRATTRLSMAT